MPEAVGTRHPHPFPQPLPSSSPSLAAKPNTHTCHPIPPIYSFFFGPFHIGKHETQIPSSASEANNECEQGFISKKYGNVAFSCGHFYDRLTLVL